MQSTATAVNNMNQWEYNMMNRNMSQVVQPVKRASDIRRSNKPMMEKRRRARINNCLNELQTFILDATEKGSPRHSKLEKADILEKTVKYLQHLQRQQSAMLEAADPIKVNKFKAGFSVCAKEIERFHALEPIAKHRLLQHLSNHFTDIKTKHHTQPQIQQVQIQIPSSPPISPREQNQELLHQQQILQVTPTNGCYVKLSNGILTYVTPQQIQHIPQVAMPTRTSSTASAASIQSKFERLSCEPTQTHICYASLSPTISNDYMDYQTTSTLNHQHNIMQTQQHSVVHMQTNFVSQVPFSPGPLSLVKKQERNDCEEELPWRPWKF